MTSQQCNGIFNSLLVISEGKYQIQINLILVVKSGHMVEIRICIRIILDFFLNNFYEIDFYPMIAYYKLISTKLSLKQTQTCPLLNKNFFSL